MEVRCVDAYEVRKQHPHARLNGFESKPYAIQWSRFAEVLYLDADNVPVRNPTFLFDTPQYAQCGAIFWPDYHRLQPDRAAWRVFGNIPYRDDPEVESGQIVIDKARYWRALTFANWCGERFGPVHRRAEGTLVASRPDAAHGLGPRGDRGDGWSEVRIPSRGLRSQADGVSGRRDVRLWRGGL